MYVSSSTDTYALVHAISVTQNICHVFLKSSQVECSYSLITARVPYLNQAYIFIGIRHEVALPSAAFG